MVIFASKKEILNEIVVFAYMLILELIVARLSADFNTAMFYFSFIDVCMILAWFAQRANIPFFLFISAAVSIFILGFREPRVDDKSYQSLFSSIQIDGLWSTFKRTTLEPGYLLLNKIVSLFTDNYTVLQVICAILFIGVFYLAVYRFRSYISMPVAVLLFHSYLYFSIFESALVRISIAVSIVAVSLQWIQKKDLKKFIIGVLIASAFHYSALVSFLFLPFIISNEDEKEISRKTAIGSLFIIPIGMLLIARVLVPVMGSRYSSYGNVGTLNFNFGSLDVLPIFFIGLYFAAQFRIEYRTEIKEPDVQQDRIDNTYDSWVGIGNTSYTQKYEIYRRRLFYVTLTATLFSSIWSIFSGLVSLGRVVYYYGVGMILLLALLDKAQEDESLRKTVIQIIIVSYAVFYVAYTRLLNAESIENLFPYMNIFFEI